MRAQHDAIRADTRRSLRSERRDASTESVAWIARSVVAGARGVPLSSRITPTVCSAGGVVSLLSSHRPSRDEKKGGASVSCTVEAAAAFRSARKSFPDDPERIPHRVQPGWFLWRERERGTGRMRDLNRERESNVMCSIRVSDEFLPFRK